MWPVVVMAGWLAAGVAPADELPVRDAGHFFSPEVLKKANAAIAAIDRQYHLDLAIETYPDVPADLRADFDPDKKAQLFAGWARERATALNVNGIYVLMCAAPRYLEIGVCQRTLQRQFTPSDRKRLLDLLRARFRKNEYDAGLLDGVAFVQQILQKNSATNDGAPPAAPRP
jgi:uncharacterized membrane protein YgcG